MMVLAICARSQTVTLKPCNASSSATRWEWNDMGFLIHSETGFVIIATGTQLDTDPKPVQLTKTPMMNPAQWIVDLKTSQLHAFRQHGDRCMQVAANVSSIEVNVCEATVKSDQIFKAPSPPGQGRGEIETGVDDSTGSALCVALV